MRCASCVNRQAPAALVLDRNPLFGLEFPNDRGPPGGRTMPWKILKQGEPSIVTKANDKLRGAAFHEAGHVVVAREFGLPVGEIAIDIDGGGHQTGRTDIGSAHHLPVTDQIALCVAGIVSQSLFTWQTHRFAGASDYARVFKLVEGLTDAESLKLRHAGYVRARKILEKHAAEVEHLAKRLIAHKRVTLG